jgi:hypothetical protein
MPRLSRESTKRMMILRYDPASRRSSFNLIFALRLSILCCRFRELCRPSINPALTENPTHAPNHID